MREELIQNIPCNFFAGLFFERMLGSPEHPSLSSCAGHGLAAAAACGTGCPCPASAPGLPAGRDSCLDTVAYAGEQVVDLG